MNPLSRIVFCLAAFCSWSFHWPLLQAQEQKITFEEHIKPIFREHCTTCHSQGDKSGGLALDSYADAMAGGSSGNVIASGNADGSRLYALMTHQQQPFMPPDSDPIAADKLELVKTWISQGMPENAGSKIKRASNAVSAMLGGTSLGKPEGPPPMPEKVLKQPVVITQRSAAVAALAASPWAPLVAVGGQEQVVLYHAQTGELLGVVPFPEGDPQSLTFTRDARQLLIGGGQHSHSGCAVLVDVVSGQRITKVGDELDIVLAADISPDKKRIAVAGPQKVIRVYDSSTGEKIFELKKHTDWIYALRFSPDGVLLASGDRSNGLVVWEAQTGNLYADLLGHRDAVTSLDFRADSNVLMSSSLDGNIKLWDMFENKEIKNWAAHPGGTTDAEFCNEGLIASAGKDAKVKLWNANGELQKEYAGLTEMALRVSIVGDGTVLAGGDWNGQVQIWPRESPEQNRPVATNPPSVQQRLEAATQLLAQAQQELTVAAQAMTATVAQSTQASQELSFRQQVAKESETRLAAVTQQEIDLKAKLTETDQRIAALEQELLALKTQRETVTGELKTASDAVVSLTQELTVAQAAVATAQTQADTLQQAAMAAQAQLDSLAAKQAAAQSALDQANADKAAIEQRAAELIALSEQTTAQAKTLADQLTIALHQDKTDAEAVERMTAELTALREQMAGLQKKIDEASGAHQQASEKHNAAKSAAQALREQAAAAEQAALEAAERVKLFNQSYGTVN